MPGPKLVRAETLGPVGALLGALVFGGCSHHAGSAGTPADAGAGADGTGGTGGAPDGGPTYVSGSPETGNTVECGGDSDARFYDAGTVDVPFANPVSLTGSYQLRWTSYTTGSPPPDVSRLDLRANGQGVDAVLTPRFGTPLALVGTLSGDALRFHCRVSLGKIDALHYGHRDVWSRLVFPRTADGGLTGAFTADVESAKVDSDATGVGMGVGAGTIAVNSNQTLVLEDVATDRPAGLRLPWDPIAFSFAEPVDPASFERAIALTRGGLPVAVSWESPPASATDWVGRTSFQAFLNDWGASDAVAWSVPAGVPGRSGIITSPTSSSFVVSAVPPAVASVSYAGAGAPAIFGPGEILGGAGNPDARCEDGSCAHLGPTADSGCNAAPATLAARLVRQGSGRVTVRFRFVGAAIAPIGAGLFRIHAQAATPGAAPLDERISSNPDAGWTSVTLQAPLGSGDIGVSMALAIREGCAEMDQIEPAPVELFVGAITVE